MTPDDRGYSSNAYEESFGGLGELERLPKSGVRVIRRSIQGGRHDYVGLYPFSRATDWSALDEDVSSLEDSGGVSLVLTVDAFGAPSAQQALSRWSVCRHFKTHFIVDLREDWRAHRSKNVRNKVNQALRDLTVEPVGNPADHAGQFWSLYEHTVRRHRISGIQRFSPHAIAEQLAVDGAILVMARDNDVPVGALLSYDEGEVGHLHLIGLSPGGSRTKSSYGLVHRSIEILEDRGCELVSLGGAAGTDDDPNDGLYRFKSRWTPHRRSSLLCGQILDQVAYDALVDRTGARASSFFPAYRTPQGPLEWSPAW